MVYSNHQSYADVLAMIYLFRDHCQMGYVAKDEWRKVKTLARAILYTRSVFLVRGSSREAVRSIKEVSDLLAQGFNFVIFPEGTRSQSHEMAEFKMGAFKFAEKGKVPILPVTVDGGYHLIEETGSYQPTHINITVHPLVHIEEMDKHAQKEAQKEIEATIRSALD
jgi:1-acyl-sn-glycerol-3-phosphate acyltransferase